ncbi:MAG: T9SS type A sorting domain-containing protein [Calditrichaeota bacterium]|nr:T9SS type A sorting domain-containing protein [Calditrichota bacterium]
MKRTTRHRRTWGLWLALAVLGATGGPCPAEARQWSEEVQLTNVGRMHMSGSLFRIVVDSRDVIHMGYKVGRAGLEGQFGSQAAYQKFDKFGQALTDPLPIGLFFPQDEDRGGHCWDVCLDRNENVHLLWGGEELFHTMFTSDGEHIQTVRLEGIVQSVGHFYGAPRMSIDSQERLVILSRTELWDPVRRWRDYFLAYGRWTFEGELIDTLHFLADGYEGEVAQDPELTIDDGDTLHISWNQHPMDPKWFYTKIAPDDERAIGPVEIPAPDGIDYRNIVSNILIDTEHRIIMRLLVHSNGWLTITDNLIQCLPNFELRYDQIIEGEGRGGFWGQLVFNPNRDRIYMAAGRVFPQFPRFGTSFASFDLDGNYIDSLQFIERRGTNTRRMALFSDSSVAVLWADSRWNNNNTGDEIFMRYSPLPNRVAKERPILPPDKSSLIAYPNPSNGSVIIQFTAQRSGEYHLSMVDLQGREIWSSRFAVNSPQTKIIQWNGNNRYGNPAPSGNYQCKVEGASTSVSIIIKRIR